MTIRLRTHLTHAVTPRPTLALGRRTCTYCGYDGPAERGKYGRNKDGKPFRCPGCAINVWLRGKQIYVLRG